MSLIRCEFKVSGFEGLQFYLEKSRYESEITEKSLRNFNSKGNENMIEIIQTKIDVDYMTMYIINAARQLKMENVDLSIEYGVKIYIGEKGHDFQTITLFQLEMLNCRMSGEIELEIYLRLPNSFGTFRFQNTVFEKYLLTQFNM